MKTKNSFSAECNILVDFLRRTNQQNTTKLVKSFSNKISPKISKKIIDALLLLDSGVIGDKVPFWKISKNDIVSGHLVVFGGQIDDKNVRFKGTTGKILKLIEKEKKHLPHIVFTYDGSIYLSFSKKRKYMKREKSK